MYIKVVMRMCIKMGAGGGFPFRKGIFLSCRRLDLVIAKI